MARSLNGEFVSGDELAALGFAALGTAVLIHRTACIVGCEQVSIGDHVRIDPFSMLSVRGGLTLGSYVHVAAHSSLVGAASVRLGDFAGLSQGARILSSSDDFSGASLTGPTVPLELRSVTDAPVTVGRHAVIGAACVVLPGVKIGDGAAVGALSLVAGDLDEWTIYAGIPARPLKPRQRRALELETQLRGGRVRQ